MICTESTVLDGGGSQGREIVLVVVLEYVAHRPEADVAAFVAEHDQEEQTCPGSTDLKRYT